MYTGINSEMCSGNVAEKLARRTECIAGVSNANAEDMLGRPQTELDRSSENAEFRRD